MAEFRKFEISGKTYELSSEIVVVLDTDVTSSTHVRGAGFVSGYANQNGGHVVGESHIRSTVSKTRNIWYRRQDGSEGHWQVGSDIPVRAGHHLRFIRLKGPNVVKWNGRNDKGVDRYQLCDRVLLGTQIIETGTYVPLDGYSSAGTLWAVHPEKSYFSTSILVWGGLFLMLFYGLGILLWLYVGFRAAAVATGSTAFGVSPELAQKRIQPIREAISRELTLILSEAPTRAALDSQSTTESNALRGEG
jgi:hypothetical protein